MPGQIPIDDEIIIREIRLIPNEYWPNLLEIVRLFRESVTLKQAEHSFRKGWQEAINDQTRPISELCDGIDAE